MTLLETCDRLRENLQNWYNEKKADCCFRFDGYKLYYAVKEFMIQFPECQEHEFDIYYDFDVIEGSYHGGCLCCENNPSRVKVKGILVEPIDWEQQVAIANCNLVLPEEIRESFVEKYKTNYSPPFGSAANLSNIETPSLNGQPTL